jgi:hypothetical protein
MEAAFLAARPGGGTSVVVVDDGGCTQKETAWVCASAGLASTRNSNSLGAVFVMNVRKIKKAARRQPLLFVFSGC